MISEPVFDLDKAQGRVKLTKDVTIGPFDTVYVSGNTSFQKHSTRLNIMVERLIEQNINSVVPVQTYTVLKPGSIRVNLGLGNLSARMKIVRSKSAKAKFSAANVIPDTLVPHITGKEKSSDKPKELSILSQRKQEKLFDEIDLSGTKEWSQEQKEQVRQLFIEFGSLFALDSLDLGKTSLVKHKIGLDDYTPFKERYH